MELRADDPEFIQVYRDFYDDVNEWNIHGGFGGRPFPVEVVGVKRLQNQRGYIRFRNRVQDLIMENEMRKGEGHAHWSGDPARQEARLYHGTYWQWVDSILQNGVDTRHSKTGSYGFPAVYAGPPQTAKGYGDLNDKQLAVMFRVRAFRGILLASNGNQRYATKGSDSGGSTNGKWSHIQVFWEPDQVFAEYMLVLKIHTTPNWKPPPTPSCKHLGGKKRKGPEGGSGGMGGMAV